MAVFKPIRAAAAASLEDLDLQDGQFIITLDTKKMYVDAVADENTGLERIALGGEIDLSNYVTETEMQEAIAAIQPSGLDFSALTTALTTGTLTGLTIVADNENENFDITITNSSGINFSDLSDAFTNGTLTGLTITPNAATETFDITVTGLPTIAIDENNEWTIDGVSTGKSARGQDGTTPTVEINTSDKHWYINGADTNVVAEGQNGVAGTNGITPTIDSTTKHWIIGETDTLVNAEGQDGISPTISFTNISGGKRMTVVDNTGTSTIDIMDGVTTISSTAINLTGIAASQDWIGTNAPYSQTVAINGVNSSLTPILDVILSNTVETALEEEKQWSYITKAETGADSITLYCYKTKPTIDLNFIVKVI